VQAAFTVRYDPAGSNGKPAFKVKPSTDKSKIAFIPAPGTLTAAQAAQITRELRRFMISKFADCGMEVPVDFKFTQFKSLVAGGTEAIALPIKLSPGGALPASALGSVTNLFLNSGDDFAVAISKDYINSMLQPLLQQIKSTIPPQSFNAVFFGGEVSISDAWVECNPGVLTAVVAGHLHIWIWNPF
jgi:hypothetical protein